MSKKQHPHQQHMQEYLERILAGQLTIPEKLQVIPEQPDRDGKLIFRLAVAEEDVPRIIGKSGHTRKAILSLVKGAAGMRGVGVRILFPLRPDMTEPARIVA